MAKISEEEIVEWVIWCDPLYESEYDGRVEERCFFCRGYYDPKKGIEHKKDCIWLLAQELSEE